GLVIDLIVVLVFGVPPMWVAVYALMRMTITMFVHGNIAVPSAIDRVLRHVVVTPDVHRIHHSIELREHNSNYSGGLIWWDKLFGTYITEPTYGQQGMKIGLPFYVGERSTALKFALVEPFLKPPANGG
ncbi:MAG: sterol desaturase family protein, partial [Gammaproteobacteria bacterium]